MIENEKSSLQETFELNIYILICCICYMICCLVPFNITDFYYSYYYRYSCIDTYLFNINIRVLLKINGYAYVIFMLYIILILTRYIKFFENMVIMKTSIFIKVSYNIIWCIFTTIIYSTIYNSCESDLKIYLMTRLCFLYIFIILSLKKIKSTLLD
jgi:hypothetical protein